ncbi:MAG: hypothetical protein LBM65_04640, partial [Oscillospiraceae bacterium]|nr:hypothetical protein [Oscillospiraceae bacterium]
MMHGNMKLLKNCDGSYDLIIEYSVNETEFAMEFLGKSQSSKSRQNAAEFLKKHAKGIKINAVRLVTAGVMLAVIPFSMFFSAFADDTERYSMTYLYGGTAQQQIEYVNRTQNAMQTVSPSYFDIVAGGSLQFNAPA